MQVSLRSKLSAAFVGVTLCGGIIAGAVADYNVRRTTVAQLEDRLAYETTMLGQMTANALFGDLDPADTSLSDPVRSLARAVRTRLEVIARDGTVVADSAADPGGLPNQAAAPEVLEARAAGVGTALRDQRLFVAGAIVRDGKTLGFARSSVPQAEVDARVDLVRKRLAYGTAASVALAVLLGLVFASGLVRPIRALADGARRVGEGDFEHRILVTTGDELGALAQSFNEMTASVRKAMRDMRLVLDNVEQGLLTLDRSGRMARERSSVVARWFEHGADDSLFFDFLAKIDRRTADSFAMSWEALLEGVMPIELSIDQLPKHLHTEGRTFSLEYTALLAGDSVDGLLVVISDVTAREAAERADSEQREILSAFERLMRDKSGFLEFVDDAQGLVGALCGEERAGLVETRRWLHTLKGNAGMFGLTALATFCHELEEEMALDGGDLTVGQRQALRGHWDGFAKRLSSLLGDHAGRRVEIDDLEYEAVLESLLAGGDRREITRMVSDWKLEPASERLARFASLGRALAVKLGKGEIDTVVDAGRIRLSREALAPLWSSFSHVVRNAVDHGLETGAARVAAGKPERGTLALRVMRSADEIVIEVADDGRGIDWAEVAARARLAGLRHETPAELTSALFHEGLTTRDEATDTSGRGVGLGAVRGACEALGGRIAVTSVEGHGTTVRLCLPASAVTQLDDRINARIPLVRSWLPAVAATA